jgi:predicted dehydrogenase
VNVLLVGAGRMGRRHLRGLRAAGCAVTVVDPSPVAREAAGADAAAAFESLADALAADAYDAAVLAETAAGRLERVAALAGAGMRSLLVEKPLEQSRARAHALAAAATEAGADARVNHVFRTIGRFQELRALTGPFQLSVVGGAYGLACNGIHWLDLALYLSGDRGGRLLYGELDDVRIASGRGPLFGDFGGRALFGFDDGTRLFLSSDARSPAPMQATVVHAALESVLFPHDALAVDYRRDPKSETPPYRYGADFVRSESPALEADDLWRATEQWARGVAAGTPPPQPTIDRALVGHDLLFDLLETSGDHEFPVT